MRSSSAVLNVIAASVLLSGCGASQVPASDGLAAISTERLALPSSPVASSPPATTTHTRGATGSDAAPPEPSDSFVGSVVTLADDGLRVRSAPRVSDDSDKLEPLLPFGTRLYVLEGPVSASGYAWYEVVPLESRDLPSGWVAGAGRDGVPWIAADDFDCPPVPTDIRSLAALPPGVGVACFPRTPITVEARLIECNCDIDGAWYTPDWFFLASGSPTLLVEPDANDVPHDFADWFELNLDPTGEHPDVLPLGQVIEVTGIFDHPAASSCKRTEMDGEPVSSQGCRLEFAVTRLLVFGP
jgi:hypothetical protein